MPNEPVKGIYVYCLGEFINSNRTLLTKESAHLCSLQLLGAFCK